MSFWTFITTFSIGTLLPVSRCLYVYMYILIDVNILYPYNVKTGHMTLLRRDVVNINDLDQVCPHMLPLRHCVLP